MRLLMLIATILFVAVPAQAAPDPSGHWAVRSNGRPLMILTVLKDEAAPGGWTGQWRRPSGFSMDAAASTLTDVTGPAIEQHIVSATGRDDGILLTFAPKPREKGGDTFLFRVLADGTARLGFGDYPSFAFVLDRAGAGEQLIAAFDPAASYPIDQHWTSNAEMKRIFDADQAARQDWASADHAAVARADAERRSQTRALLDAGKLASADDFYHAAFVFQHGEKPADYLLAHSLAVISAARGRPGATWIASATLDRYLQAIGQKQIYGTQFQVPNIGPATQEPYDRALVSDALRAALGVPSLAEQETQRSDFERKRGGATTIK